MCTLYRITFRADTKIYLVWTATAQNWNKSLTSVLVDSGPHSRLFTSAMVPIPVHTAPKWGTEPIRYVRLHFRDRCGTASVRSLTEIAPKSPDGTGSGTRFTRHGQMQIIEQTNVKPSRTPQRRTHNSFENVFQRFGWSFVSFLPRKHDLRRRISTFIWRILFEKPENPRFEVRDRNSRTSWHAQWLSCCKNASGWRRWY